MNADDSSAERSTPRALRTRESAERDGDSRGKAQVEAPKPEPLHERAPAGPTLARRTRDNADRAEQRSSQRLLRGAAYLMGLQQDVLEAREFERFLVRERELADRGTRTFSLLILRRRRGEKNGFKRLALQLRGRLRSTDLVGRLDEDRIEVLLTDTGPAGANAVADWIDSVVAEIGIQVEPTIYVYPTIEEGRERTAASVAGDPQRQDEGRAGHGGNSRTTNGHVGTDPDSASPMSGGLRMRLQRGGRDVHGSAGTLDLSKPRASASSAVVPEAGSARESVRWPMEDLWSQLSAPMPGCKRALDIALASFALLALLPLFALVALAIRIDSRGPVIFRQQRAGLGGRSFAFYKFRSMRVDAEAQRAELEALNEQRGPVFKMRRDPRITNVGRWLRRWSLDELPQLWNVVKGDLSLVGPRSPTLNELPQYERWQRRRLNVTGGVTCIWQVSGRSQVTFRNWMRMDMRYAARRSFGVDLLLLLRTLPAVISGRGAY
jgi:lipopolysaccharide/colanic/teichoic acid biosynthesis glycosyltransferase